MEVNALAGIAKKTKDACHVHERCHASVNPLPQSCWLELCER